MFQRRRRGFWKDRIIRFFNHLQRAKLERLVKDTKMRELVNMLDRPFKKMA